MKKEISVSGINKNFESIKKINSEGVEYWKARELMSILGYDRWENFQKVISKAVSACINSQQDVKNHFLDVTKMVNIGSKSQRDVQDYNLSRYACYLVAQNGDPRKKAIAVAQTYFAVKTRIQEVSEQSTEDHKRLFIRKEVKDQNKKLFLSAQKAGVSNFGKFNNYGYLGLYALTADGIKEKKGIGEDNILDRAGSTELAANLFRITQTDEKICNKEISCEEEANATHYDVGRKVRDTIAEIGGTMPEKLPPEKHIREIEKIERKQLKATQKKQLKGGK